MEDQISSTSKYSRRWILLVAVVVVAVVVAGSLAPIPQPAWYHDFADKRSFFGIPNAGDVLSNIPFVLVGLAGLYFAVQRRRMASEHVPPSAPPKRDQMDDGPVMSAQSTRAEVADLYRRPLSDLLLEAQETHRRFHQANEVQMCRLLSIKTGGCPEDCAYCPQSARYSTGVERQALMNSDEILPAARRARDEGSTRFCMGAAWRQAPEGREWDSVLESVRAVAALGMEVCCTLGMLTEKQAVQLKAAGLTAYNHNLDSSPEFYGNIISTRVYQERLDTIAAVRKAGITVCCGGILGMGESEEDRIGLLHQLASLDPPPESVPINMLVRAEGTPLEHSPDLDPLIMVRTIACARILMPSSMVRLAAGRKQMSREAILLCFLAGANSIFTGERLLTTPNPAPDEDAELLDDLGLKPMHSATRSSDQKSSGSVRESIPAQNRKIRRNRFNAWSFVVLFAGLLLTGFGSAYYHLAPDNQRLLWDRLPMTIAMAGVITLLLENRLPSMPRWVLPTLVLIGLGSVLQWSWSESHGAGDLRWYVLFQALTFIVGVLLLIMFPARNEPTRAAVIILVANIAAKILESLDKPIFAAGGIVSGHTLKHLAAALGFIPLVMWLAREKTESAEKCHPKTSLSS